MSEMKEEIISVIIPVYNTEKEVARCLDSVLLSDYGNLEVLCVNDGSTDESLDVLNGYARHDDRVKIIDAPHGGVSAARNLGLEKAAGDFIAFVDSDDIVHRQYFSVLAYFQRKFDADIISVKHDSSKAFSAVKPVFADKLEFSLYQGVDALAEKQVKFYIWGKLYRKTVVEDIRFMSDLRYGEDTLFSMDCFASGKPLVTAVVNCPLYGYMKRGSSATGKTRYYDNLALCYAFQKRINSMNDEKAAGIYVDEIFRRLLPVRYKITGRKGYEESAAEFDRVLKKNAEYERKNRCLPACKSLQYRIMVKKPKLFGLMYRLKSKS